MEIGNFFRLNDSQTIYDFTNLDKFLSWLHEFKLSPRFELMAEKTEKTFVSKDPTYWHNLTREIVNRYSGRTIVKQTIFYCCNGSLKFAVKFGKAFTKWKFETWNEPDLKGYNKLNFSFQGLCTRNPIQSNKSSYLQNIRNT